jgi:hypothetical protein
LPEVGGAGGAATTGSPRASPDTSLSIGISLINLVFIKLKHTHPIDRGFDQ